LRKSRLDKKLLQKEVGRQLGVNECTIYNWETNRILPSLVHIPEIIKFLGYIPWKVPAEDIKMNRQLLGISQESLARQIGVDPGTLARWESGAKKPAGMFIQKLKEFFRSFNVSVVKFDD
jgi:transcriptional regulator with XRE-family HTH domain